MRKFILLLNMYFIALIFSSCKNEVLTEGNGEWKCEKLIYAKSKKDETINYINSPAIDTTLQCVAKKDGTYSFDKDGGGYQTIGRVSLFTWKKSGNSIILTEPGEDPKKYTIILDKNRSQEWTIRDTDEYATYLYKILLYKETPVCEKDGR